MLEKSLVDSLSFFRHHFLSISFIILPIVIPLYTLIGLYQHFLISEQYILSEQILPMTVSLAAYPLYTVAVIFYIASVISGKSSTTQAFWKLGIKFWLPYMILHFLVSGMIMFGLIFLIVPGVILAVRCAFAKFDLLLNQSRPLDAIKNSWDSTKAYAWILLGGYMIITIVLYVPYYLFASLAGESIIVYRVLDVVYSVVDVLYIIFAFRVYEFSKSQQ
jgi:hypothetical protein